MTPPDSATIPQRPSKVRWLLLGLAFVIALVAWFVYSNVRATQAQEEVADAYVAYQEALLKASQDRYKWPSEEPDAYLSSVREAAKYGSLLEDVASGPLSELTTVAMRLPDNAHDLALRWTNAERDYLEAMINECDLDRRKSWNFSNVPHFDKDTIKSEYLAELESITEEFDAIKSEQEATSKKKDTARSAADRLFAQFRALFKPSIANKMKPSTL